MIKVIIVWGSTRITDQSLVHCCHCYIIIERLASIAICNNISKHPVSNLGRKRAYVLNRGINGEPCIERD